MKNSTFIIGIVFMIASSAFADDAGSKLYNQLIERYQSITTYEDEGVTTYTVDSDHPFKRTIHFRTCFHNPNSIRFEFWMNPVPSMPDVTWTTIFCHAGGKTQYWDSDGSIEDVDRLTTAFAKASGVSGFSAPKIPSLLLDEGLGAGIHRLVEPRLEGEENVDERLCYRLRVKRRNGIVVVIWISKDDMLIRRINDHEYETSYTKIVIDKEVSDELFRLNQENSIQPKKRTPTSSEIGITH